MQVPTAISSSPSKTTVKCSPSKTTVKCSPSKTSIKCSPSKTTVKCSPSKNTVIPSSPPQHNLSEIKVLQQQVEAVPPNPVLSECQLYCNNVQQSVNLCRSKSKSNICLNSENLTSSLRPCLRHTRLLSQSCDDILKTESNSSEVMLKTSMSRGSLCSNSNRTVKFLLPEKQFLNVLCNDSQLQRFSMGLFVPASSYKTVPYYNKSWQNQFKVGQNLDRYLWTTVCCPCYQCYTYRMPYSYNFGHLNSQFSLTRNHRPLTSEITSNSDISKTINTSSKREGTFQICMALPLHILCKRPYHFF